MQSTAPRARKALFLDRDGVINVDRGYVYRCEEFEFVPGIFELCHSAQYLGYALVVVTNQAGIARGFYSECDFQRLTSWMNERFAEHDVQIEQVYHCPYHPLAGIGAYRRDSRDRKPHPGMILRAARDLNLDLRASILIGDKLTDMSAGAAAGVGTRILLESGTNKQANSDGSYHACHSLDEIRLNFFAAPALADTMAAPVL